MKKALGTPLNARKRALILAAGVRSRVRQHNALHNLGRAGLEQVTIVVGYRKEAIQNACGSHFGGVAIKYVDSPVRIVPGVAYSLWLARDTLLSGDLFVLEGDVFFEENALRQLFIR
ncbi:NDP-sugar pyrophosphorylase family protein [Bradyrhizobium sp. USDA 4354]